MKEKKQGKKHKSKIGGQALIEGIMMRGIDKISMAVRLPDGSIDVEDWPAPNISDPPLHRKIPVMRGVINFAESMALGYKCLIKSAEKSDSGEEEPEEEMTKFEKKITELFGDKLIKYAATVGMFLGVAVAIVLFMFFPVLIVKGIDTLIPLEGFKTLAEGVIKIAIFIGYLSLMLLLKDIKRTFEYHGAEHKAISCYESGEELNIENVRKFSRFHPRCGTSFMIIMLIISILVFSLLPWGGSAWLRVGLKLLALPIVVGLGYELIKIAGRYTNLFTKIISAPGMALQRLTTKEPDDSQIEIAISALSIVIPENKETDSW